MFTGIVQGMAELLNVEKKQGYRIFTLKMNREHTCGLETGASVSVDGVCLTAVCIHEDTVAFDVIDNSLKITTMDQSKVGDFLNYERSMTGHSEIGGHLLSGHVDFTGRVVQIENWENSFGVTIGFEPKWSRYLFEKGFVGLNGASLTVCEINKQESWLRCWIIPETLRRTNISAFAQGSFVNVELDRNTQVLVDTISLVAEEKFGALGSFIETAIGQLGLLDELRSHMVRQLNPSAEPSPALPPASHESELSAP